MAASPHLYVHVPFCAHRCGYCDFVTTAHQPELHGRYVDALAREHALRGDDSTRYDTIFVGGGTPSLLEAPALTRLVSWLAGMLAPGGELTIECNPETIDAERARLLVDGGITRVSLGAQSFTQHVLATLERRATPDTVRGAVAALRDAGIDNLNLDVIWGVPGQTHADLQHDLDQLIAIAPDHVSAYELEFKPGTRLAHSFPNPTETLGETVDDYYELVVERLEAAGMTWYETANFARAGRECRHNLGYWEKRDYLGIGVGAVGTVAGERRTNLPNLPRYLAAIDAGELPPARTEHVDDTTHRIERIMLGLRLARPLRLDDADRKLLEPGGIARLAEWGHLVRDGDSIELTRSGRYLLNGVLGELLAEQGVPSAAATTSES
jgi:oxygen-independent coproporphyrinogen-3 oxidase